MIRFSLRRLLITIAVSAIALFSLLWANELVAHACRFVTSVAMLASLLTLIVGLGNRRAFAIGFFAVAGIYHASLFAQPVLNSRYTQPWMGLGTLRFINLSYDLVKREMYRPEGSDEWTLLKPTGPSVMVDYFPDYLAFAVVGSDFVGLLLGFAGGSYAARIYQRRVRETKYRASSA